MEYILKLNSDEVHLLVFALGEYGKALLLKSIATEDKTRKETLARASLAVEDLVSSVHSQVVEGIDKRKASL